MSSKINKKNFLEHTKKAIKEQLEAPDQRIIYLSQVSNKLPQIINELYEQLRIISDRKYPTLDSFVSIKDYCLFIYENNQKHILKENIKEVTNIIESDIGITFNDYEKKILKNISKSILDLINIKEQILLDIETQLEKNYKNFKEIATTQIACQMLEIAGSFKRLCSMPASTIQLLGAEKSFFLALRRHKKTPKYGVLYNHPLMINLSKRNKGRFARTLASKITIALKADINKSDISQEILTKLKKKINTFN
jgi:nucleolar protein 56